MSLELLHCRPLHNETAESFVAIRPRNLVEFKDAEEYKNWSNWITARDPRHLSYDLMRQSVDKFRELCYPKRNPHIVEVDTHVDITWCFTCDNGCHRCWYMLQDGEPDVTIFWRNSASATEEPYWHLYTPNDFDKLHVYSGICAVEGIANPKVVERLKEKLTRNGSSEPRLTILRRV